MVVREFRQVARNKLDATAIEERPVAVGRRPNSKIPGLEKTAVKVDAKGFIETDPQRRTA